jgi:hypothetical protein
MSFEADVMANAVDIQNTAIFVAWKQGADPHYARTSGPELYFENVANEFRPYSQMPDPAAYDHMLADLEQVLHKLSSGLLSQDPIEHESYFANGNLDEISGASDFLDKWHGGAAEAFKDTFIDWFPSVVKNQFIVAATVRSALRAYQHMWSSARTDLLEIQKQTLAALEAHPCCSQNDWQITFTVIEAVATIAAVPIAAVDPPLGVELAVAGVAATAGAAANWPHDSESPQQNTSQLAWQVIDDMNRALDRLRHEIAATEQKITTVLDRNNAYVDANLRSFVNPRPQLAGATASTITQFMGFAS